MENLTELVVNLVTHSVGYSPAQLRIVFVLFDHELGKSVLVNNQSLGVDVSLVDVQNVNILVNNVVINSMVCLVEARYIVLPAADLLTRCLNVSPLRALACVNRPLSDVRLGSYSLEGVARHLSRLVSI